VAPTGIVIHVSHETIHRPLFVRAHGTCGTSSQRTCVAATLDAGPGVRLAKYPHRPKDVRDRPIGSPTRQGCGRDDLSCQGERRGFLLSGGPFARSGKPLDFLGQLA